MQLIDKGHYHLLEAGDGRKLEQLGDVLVNRQATQALWPLKGLNPLWRKVQAEHQRSKSGGGRWLFPGTFDPEWQIQHGGIRFKIKLTDFGHIGLFPEQSSNWDWLRQHAVQPDAAVLNLFSYTGGSTLACSQAGGRVTHVDASKGVVTWARENAALNQLEDRPIRWIVEDVLKYLRREEKRGSRYQGLILDPPSYGRGAKGETWKIEDDLVPLLRQAKRVLDDDAFVLLSCHTPGYSPVVLQNLLVTVLGYRPQSIETGEMTVPIQGQKLELPSGAYARALPR